MYLKKGSRGEDVKILQKLLYLKEDGVFGDLTEEAVKDFQKANGLTVDGIVGNTTWMKLNSHLKVSKRTINEIIVHCSATKEGKDFTVADIKKWHLERGFSDIGYHYVIYRDGSIYEGRNVDISGAHCTGHNSHSIGVCYIGGLDIKGKPKDTRTVSQKNSMMNLLKQLKSIYPKASIYPHSKFAKKDCPCFDAEKEYKCIK